MKALVLSGGGSKGSYQIGVWKALKKLHIKFDIVTGTSVGALNGALITQKSYFRAIKLWKKINLKLLFGENAIDSTNDLKVMTMYGKEFLKNGGMEVKKLENLIEKEIRYKKLMKSKINYGLVTFNLTTKKPVQITKKEIPKHLIGDYLMASASCYPAFKQKNIDGERYIDGGFFDNLPINLAIEMGADEIVAVDLSAPGFNKTPRKKVPTIKIKPNNKLTNFLNFYEEGAKRNIRLGYNDTLKKFGKLEGKKYTFKKRTIEKNNKKHFETFIYLLENILDNENTLEKFKKLINLSGVPSKKIIDKIGLKIMEELAKDFHLDETKIYSEKSFNKELKKKLNKEQSKETEQFKKLIIEIKENKKSLKKKILLNPWNFLKALYLYTISEV
ncbi:MAG: patatin-like phospholipase family protein [Candidatus Faecimonas sp.]|nr:patatin-like phospholipase family protein [Mycoplasmatota bacterium]MDY2908188.1 patatin-like phospholipase family protein [Candidatus Faecimonas sp.]